jgi:integrase
MSTAFGDKPLSSITADDIELFRAARKAEGLSAVTVNHDLKLLRKMFNWAIRKEYLKPTPFKAESVTVISLEREIRRHWRFNSDEDEQKLLDAANPHLRAVLIAMLDTAARPGEILSLQWKDVNLERRELVIRAEKSKTRTERIVPISTRLIGTLEMRRLDPAGEPVSPNAYVFW